MNHNIRLITHLNQKEIQKIHAFEHTIISLASSHTGMLELWFHTNCKEVLEFLVVRNKKELQSKDGQPK